MAKRKDTDFKPIFTRDTCQENKKVSIYTIILFIVWECNEVLLFIQ
jgi:hypothetical protein